jgi:tetratricopeptide (TPR) repeat protein
MVAYVLFYKREKKLVYVLISFVAVIAIINIIGLEQAIFYAEKGNAVYPKNTLLHLLSGQFYFKKNDFDNSIQHFIVVTKNDTSLSEPLVYLGDTYYAKNNFDSSLFYYQLALKKVPKNAELINNISTVYFEKGEKENCLQFNYDLLKKDSTLYAAYENLGYYFLSEKDTAKARSYFKQGEKHGLKPVNINSLK